MNREQRIYASHLVIERLKKDVRDKIISYMDKVGVDMEKVAYEVGVDEDAIVRIVKGDGNMTLETLTRLMLFAGLVVEICPLVTSPLYEQFEVPIDEMEFDPGELVLPFETEEVANDIVDEKDDEYYSTIEPLVDIVEDDDVDFDNMSRNQLICYILNNDLDNKINPFEESRDTLIKFLKDEYSTYTKDKSDDIKDTLVESTDEKFPIDERVLELKEKIKSTINKNQNLARFFKELLRT